MAHNAQDYYAASIIAIVTEMKSTCLLTKKLVQRNVFFICIENVNQIEHTSVQKLAEREQSPHVFSFNFVIETLKMHWVFYS